VDIVVKKCGITDEQPCSPTSRQFTPLIINHLNSYDYIEIKGIQGDKRDDHHIKDPPADERSNSVGFIHSLCQ
jgi:hypothetical protein